MTTTMASSRDLKFKVHTKVGQPLAEVFEAVYDPGRLKGYFTTGGASAPLDEGTRAMWEFADHPGPFPVDVIRMVRNELIAFEWDAQEGGYRTRVEMRFEALDAKTTLVTISESGWRDTPTGLESSYGNCQGWSQMLSCLKAYVEHGINLREGAY